MASTVRTWAVIKKHIPMIKFRSQLNSSGHSAESVSITPAPTPTVIETIAAVIEDWQLAPRYQRKPMSVEEMEYINRGGPM